MPMSDRYQQLTDSPPGRFIAKRLGLPESRPLRRYEPGQPAPRRARAARRRRPRWATTVDRRRSPALGAEIRQVAPDDEDVSARRARLRRDRASSDSARPARAVRVLPRRDPLARRRAAGCVVLGTPPELPPSRRAGGRPARARGLRALGRQGAAPAAPPASSSTSRPGAEANAESTLRFLLSGRSAYVSGQVIRVGAGAADRPAGLGAAAGRPASRSSPAPRAASAPRSPRRSRATARTSSASTSPPRARTLAEVANEIGGSALQLDITAERRARRGSPTHLQRAPRRRRRRRPQRRHHARQDARRA